MKTKEKLSIEFKKQWITALKSGKYKQGKGSLYQPYKNTFCCLGVAGQICDIPLNDLMCNSFLYSFSSNKIPELLKGSIPTSIPVKLSSFNDNGKSFKWIASYIERYL